MPVSALLLPAHGHAPYLIGAGLLRKIAAEICIPAYYGEDQRRILLDRFPGDADCIFLSSSMGKLMEPLLVGRKGSSQRQTVSNVNEYANDVREHAGRISSALEMMLSHGIEATSLTGETRIFSHVDLALNLGLPVRSPVNPVFFAFAGKLSEIYRLSPYQSRGVAFLTQAWKELEWSFQEIFVPRLHSLCHRKDFEAAGITFTPPFAGREPVNTTDSIRPGSCLLVVSGTGMQVRKLLQLVRSSAGPWITLPESPRQIPAGQVLRKSSRAWGNPHVTAILARSGMGTIWQAIVNGKPIGVLPADPGTDPEVSHNARMVEALGIGKIVEKNMDGLVRDLPRYRAALEEHEIRDCEAFGTTDGIAYTSALLEQTLAVRSEKTNTISEIHEAAGTPVETHEGGKHNEPILAG